MKQVKSDFPFVKKKGYKDFLKKLILLENILFKDAFVIMDISSCGCTYSRILIRRFGAVSALMKV